VSTTLAFDSAGTGSVTVLLLHGVGGGRRLWMGDEGSDTLSALAQAGFHAVCADLPGYGDSPLCLPLSMATMARAVHELIDALAAPKTVVVGHSMGGMVALELAATAPQAVAGLVLACTSASFGKADGAWQAQFLRERLAPLDAGRGMAALAGMLVQGMLARGAPAEASQRAVAIMSRVPEATYRAALQGIAGFDRREALPRIGVPTLLLAGEHDRTAPPDVMQRMAMRMPGGEYRCLEGSGHIANLEKPQAFNAALLSFLRRHFALS
jgi:3-oxoadipate enol-lactonase